MDDDFEIDPEIAAAMGFTSFGSKRRKHHAPREDDAATDNTSKAPASTGANNMPLGTRSTTSDNQEERGVADTDEHQERGIAGTGAGQAAVGQEPGEVVDAGGAQGKGDQWTPGFPSREELAALRRGVRNARGDMVVFMPSFVGDPWEGLG